LLRLPPYAPELNQVERIWPLGTHPELKSDIA
jgi:hypothetical protein